MNIIIPLGGKGERFKNEGYKLRKPLTEYFITTNFHNLKNDK